MKYFVIAGEASGDLHARHLMEAVAKRDSEADIRYWYRPDLAYMGVISVVKHLRDILRGERDCKTSIEAFQPDKLILVDYPGFNLRIARWFKEMQEAGSRKQNENAWCCDSEVIYYIIPKIWAWKEGRIRQIKRYVDRCLSILPFEVDWFQTSHHYHVDYVGNPTADEIKEYLLSEERRAKSEELKLRGAVTIALLPGSRVQEIVLNLPNMIKALDGVGEKYIFQIAQAPGMSEEFYQEIIDEAAAGLSDATIKERISLHKGSGNDAHSTFQLLEQSCAALVTSGTATLETCLLNVPQVVCYNMRYPHLMSQLRKIVLHIPYVSLVNLICGREIVPELIAADMTVENVHNLLMDILPGGGKNALQLEGYSEVHEKLGSVSAPDRAAELITVISAPSSSVPSV